LAAFPHVAKNPVLHVETRSKSDYKAIVITPAQTLAILKALPSLLHFTLVLTCAATALRASEILALRWSDLLWNEGMIRISKRWAKGKDGETKTDASDGYVPLHATLVAHLRRWREQSLYSKDTDFAFPSLKARGHVPLSASVFVADHLRPAAKKAGVRIEDGQRFGLHQPSPFNQQLDGEQSQSRTENRSGNLASRQDSDDARSVHAGRRR
jgi:integrase